MPRRRLDSTALASWIEFRFDRAEGPGGQNVNKVNTRATVLLDFEACPLLTAPERMRIRQRLASRLSADGRLRVVAQRQRTQTRNRAAAEERLVELLAGALQVSKPRRATRPTLASRHRRVNAKLRRGQIKEGRQQRNTSGD